MSKDPICGFEPLLLKGAAVSLGTANGDHAGMDHSAHEGMPGSHAGMDHSMHGTEGGHHVMEGIPLSMAMVGLGLIILFSHLLVNRKKEPVTTRWRYNLLQWGWTKRLVRNPYFPLIMQSVSLFMLLLIITAGLIGHPKQNIGPVLTWTWWWVLLIFLVLGFGKVFCMICPWEASSSLVTSLSLKSRFKKLGFEKPWPKWARNIFPAIFFFILLTWFELGNDVTRSASMTALLGITMLSMAVVSATVFEKRAFCRYGCLVGRISGLYALFSPVELRAQSTDVCRSCTSKACYTGTEQSTGCPTFLFPAKLRENTYCTLCTECVRSCPHDNIGINLRPLGADLFQKIRFQWDEAVLAVVLLALTSFHGLTMTPFWGKTNNLIRAETGLGPAMTFSILMILMLILPILLFWGGAKLARWLAPKEGVKTSDIFKAFAYSLVPVALFYHLAHNCMHFFMEAQNLIPLLSDPFGFGWNLFNTAGKTYAPWLSLETIWYLQIACIVIGHLYGVLVADRIAKKLFQEPRLILRGLVPLIATMILYSAFSVWLIAQPMEMRSGM